MAEMPPELGPDPELLGPIVLLLAVGVWMGMVLQHIATRMRARAWRKRNYPKAPKRQTSWPPAPTQDTRAFDAADQLRAVMNADFTARPLLNRNEARVFEELCQTVTRCRPGWRVMAQVSLGEILRSKDTEAFGCINAKRVDMLLIDEGCRPLHAIEYQGGGHYQGSAAARDAIKKEALRRAGIGYHEVVSGKTTPGELRQLVETLIKAEVSPQ